MNTNFFVNGRFYKTPCKTVLNADEFIVEFLTGKHSIVAKVSDKCYFLSIGNITLSDIKCDFQFSRNYTNPKEFLSNLYETFVSFLNTFISDENCPLCKNTNEVLDRILEIVTATDSGTTEAESATETKPETATDTVTTETEETTDPEIGKFVYDVGIHNFYECRTFTVRADNLESAEYKALKRMKNGKDDKEYYSIDFIRIHKENSEEKSELNTKYGVLADDQFHYLTKTLIKSLFKAIGTNETRKIPFIISNNMVFFNYNGTQYKYYPSQCKIFKKRGQKYQRINWKNFAEENKPEGQKQNSGRSPPFLLLI